MFSCLSHHLPSFDEKAGFLITSHRRFCQPSSSLLDCMKVPATVEKIIGWTCVTKNMWSHRARRIVQLAGHLSDRLLIFCQGESRKQFIRHFLHIQRKKLGDPVCVTCIPNEYAVFKMSSFCCDPQSLWRNNKAPLSIASLGRKTNIV